MDNANLSQVLCEEVKRYADGGRGANIRLYFLSDDDHCIYAVNAVDDPIRPPYGFDERPSDVMVMARVEGEMIIIEDDATDKPLVDALMQRGIPRNQIILAYAGEPIPAPAEAK